VDSGSEKVKCPHCGAENVRSEFDTICSGCFQSLEAPADVPEAPEPVPAEPEPSAPAIPEPEQLELPIPAAEEPAEPEPVAPTPPVFPPLPSRGKVAPPRPTPPAPAQIPTSSVFSVGERSPWRRHRRPMTPELRALKLVIAGVVLLGFFISRQVSKREAWERWEQAPYSLEMKAPMGMPGGPSLNLGDTLSGVGKGNFLPGRAVRCELRGAEVLVADLRYTWEDAPDDGDALDGFLQDLDIDAFPTPPGMGPGMPFGPGATDELLDDVLGDINMPSFPAPPNAVPTMPGPPQPAEKPPDQAPSQRLSVYMELHNLTDRAVPLNPSRIRMKDHRGTWHGSSGHRISGGGIEDHDRLRPYGKVDLTLHYEPEAGVRPAALGMPSGVEEERAPLATVAFLTLTADDEAVPIPEEAVDARRRAQRAGGADKEAALTEALELCPEWVDVRRELADLYRQTERHEEAIRELERALVDRPNDPLLLRSMAETLMQAPEPHRDPARAIQLGERILDVELANWHHLGDLARAYAALGNTDRAVETIDKALGRHPNCPVLRGVADEIRPPRAEAESNG